MVNFRGSENAIAIPEGTYLILNADKAGANGTYLSFQSGCSALFSRGPLFSVYANTLLLSGDRAVQWKVNYPPQFETGKFSLQCVWMGPKGKGHTNFGKVVQVGSMGRARLVNDAPPVPIQAYRVPNTSDQFYLEVIDEQKGKNKHLYAAGTKVTLSGTQKSVWKFVLLDSPEN